MQRKHTTTACQTCRDSKIKCDGGRPTCETCGKKGKLCHYSTKDDKRKISLKVAVDVLFARLEQVTSLALQNGLQLPTASLEETTLLEQICTILELPSDRILPVPQSQTNLNHPLLGAKLSDGPVFTHDQSFDPLPVEPPRDHSIPFDMENWNDMISVEPWEESPSDWPWQIFNDFSASETSAPIMIREPSRSNQTLNKGRSKTLPGNDLTGGESTSEDELESDIVPRLAARFGSLRVGADGRVRYYGSAANHHLLTNINRREEIVDKQAMRREGLIALENANLNLEVPDDLQNHLFELFFKWHNPGHLTVDQVVFENARNHSTDDPNTYCSPALMAAMCALGASFEGRYHHSFVTFPKSLAEYFADKSKILLEIELESPCVSTLQTLLLLSCHEATAGRDVRMWLYSGTAMRLAFDLGLHIDSTPYVEQGLFTVQEAEARRTCFWSCLVVNHIWSFSLGRPFRVDSEELTVQRLGTMAIHPTPDSQTYWPTEPNSATSNISSVQRMRDPSSLILEQWVYFCEELAPLYRVLYGCAQISKSALFELSSQTTARFLKWPETIPEAIRVMQDRQTLPHILLLHMAYHNFCILLFRPWTSKGSQPPGSNRPGFQHARNVCLKAASEIASLLRIYESHYGFRTINVYVVTIIFSASLILVFGMIAESSADRQEGQSGAREFGRDLNTCFRALDVLSQSFDCAKRSREELFALQAHWSQKREELKRNPKRGRTVPAPEPDHVLKRSRTLQSQGSISY